MSKDVELLYVRGLTVPKSIGKGRVLVHNFVPQRNDTAVGVNGFCAWTQFPERRSRRVRLRMVRLAALSVIALTAVRSSHFRSEMRVCLGRLPSSTSSAAT